MTAREQHHYRNHGQAHRCSLAHVLWMGLVACSVDPIPDRAPVDPDDLDGDGIPNAADICPTTFDPSQHDEDGDGVGDACDRCPSTPDPGQVDSGEVGTNQFGDGIGDACDPRPGRDGDRLIQFDAFDDDSSADWRGSGWQIGADVARTIVLARWEHPALVAGDGLYAELVVPSLIWLSGGSVEVTVDGDGATGGLTCAIVHAPDGSEQMVAREIGGQTVTAPLAGVTFPATITAWRTIDIDRVGRFLCRINSHELVLPVPDAFPSGSYAFASSGALTDVSSIIAYTFPINPCAFSAGLPACH